MLRGRREEGWREETGEARCKEIERQIEKKGKKGMEKKKGKKLNMRTGVNGDKRGREGVRG